MSSVLPVEATLLWADQSVGEDAHEIVILSNGWLRVTWPTGAISHISPAAVKGVVGKGVSYGA